MPAEPPEPPSFDALLADAKKLQASSAALKDLELELAARSSEVTLEYARLQRDLRQSLRSLRDPPPHVADAAAAVRERLERVSGEVPRPPPPLLSFVLGTPTPSRIPTQPMRVAYKTSYETFKLRAALLSSFLAILNLVFPSPVIDALFLFLLLWYYSTLTLREHVLAANGSRIKPWWLLHHLLTSLLSGLLLVWPSSPGRDAFRPRFYFYAVYLGLVQYLQYRYQTARLYTLRSLGQTNAMETVSGEGTSALAGREVQWLLPYLAGGWGWQLFLAYLGVSDWSRGGGWHGLVIGGVWAVLGVGNAWVTLDTFWEKARRDRWVLWRLGWSGESDLCDSR